jgi:hypothetical protein
MGIGSQQSWLLKLHLEASRVSDLDKLYALVARLRAGIGGVRTLSECTGRNAWPAKGVYLFFEGSENRMSAPFEQRITRVGTHSVSRGSKTTLWHRLRTHRGGGDDGGGNHRGSIFRLHVGEALIKKQGFAKKFAEWGRGQSAPSAIRNTEVELEQLVSRTIGTMAILWLAVEDESSPLSDRAYLERNIIGLLSGPSGPIDLPSSQWLGNNTGKEAITSSGLWNINHVDYSYDQRFLSIFDQYVEITLGNVPAPRSSIAPRNWHAQARIARAEQLKLI